MSAFVYTKAKIGEGLTEENARVRDALERSIKGALAPSGWTDDFWERYYADPWVFNLANGVERLSDALSTLLADCAPGPGEGHIPNAPSERSYMAAKALLDGR